MSKSLNICGLWYEAGRLVAGAAVCMLGACAITAPIEPTASSRSGFDGAMFRGTTVKAHHAAPGRESFRVFQQGATGFVPIQMVRDEAERRANDFCKRTAGGVMESLEETTANPPFIPGNFPRIEIVFDCVPPVEPPAIASRDLRYSELVRLKKLLDDGIVTQAEYNAEKAKILGQPENQGARARTEKLARP